MNTVHDSQGKVVWPQHLVSGPQAYDCNRQVPPNPNGTRSSFVHKRSSGYSLLPTQTPQTRSLLLYRPPDPSLENAKARHRPYITPSRDDIPITVPALQIMIWQCQQAKLSRSAFATRMRHEADQWDMI